MSKFPSGRAHHLSFDNRINGILESPADERESYNRNRFQLQEEENEMSLSPAPLPREKRHPTVDTGRPQNMRRRRKKKRRKRRWRNRQIWPQLCDYYAISGLEWDTLHATGAFVSWESLLAYICRPRTRAGWADTESSAYPPSLNAAQFHRSPLDVCTSPTRRTPSQTAAEH